MQDSKYIEQLRQELVELSPDFAHDEKKIKKLITYMLTHKIKVEQENHFKDQLADRLSRHIAWSKESHDIDPKVQARTSRLGRFIAYGLPGLVLCVIVLITMPWTPSLTPSHSLGLNDSSEMLDIVQDPVLVSSWNIPEINTTVIETSSPTQDIVKHIQVQEFPIVQTKKVSEQLVTEDLWWNERASVAWNDQSPPPMLMKTSFSEDMIVDTTMIEPSVTFEVWQQFMMLIAKRLDIAITIKEWTMLDCVNSDAISCSILRDFEFSKENKIKLLNEIQRILEIHGRNSDYLFQLLQDLKSS